MMMRRNISSHLVKHIPQRTCVACRKIRAKHELIRLVHVAEGRIEVDIGGKKAGRGVYLCPSRECWQTGFKGDRLEHSLRAILTPDNREQLVRFGKNFLKE